MSEFNDAITDAIVERMARAMIEHGGGIPDLMVHPGEPQIFGTPRGAVFRAAGSDPMPMWTLYTGSARLALELAVGIMRAEDTAQVRQVFPVSPVAVAVTNPLPPAA